MVKLFIFSVLFSFVQAMASPKESVATHFHVALTASVWNASKTKTQLLKHLEVGLNAAEKRELKELLKALPQQLPVVQASGDSLQVLKNKVQFQTVKSASQYVVNGKVYTPGKSENNLEALKQALSWVASIGKTASFRSFWMETAFAAEGPSKLDEVGVAALVAFGEAMRKISQDNKDCSLASANLSSGPEHLKISCAKQAQKETTFEVGGGGAQVKFSVEANERDQILNGTLIGSAPQVPDQSVYVDFDPTTEEVRLVRLTSPETTQAYNSSELSGQPRARCLANVVLQTGRAFRALCKVPSAVAALNAFTDQMAQSSKGPKGKK